MQRDSDDFKKQEELLSENLKIFVASKQKKALNSKRQYDQ